LSSESGAFAPVAVDTSKERPDLRRIFRLRLPLLPARTGYGLDIFNPHAGRRHRQGLGVVSEVLKPERPTLSPFAGFEWSRR
jgi:hypothetical protein